MKTLYSIIYSPISVIGQERINFGLLLFNGEGKLLFNYSTEKLESAKQLFSSDAFKLIKTYLKTLDNKFTDKKQELLQENQVSADYVEYLSRYSNNLMSFTNPQEVNVELTIENFNSLFEKIIFKKPEVKLQELIRPINGIAVVKMNFAPKVQKRVNLDVELRTDEHDFVLFNTHIDMMGKNDIPVLNQFIEFEYDTPAMLEKKINSYIGLIKPFEAYDGNEGKYFMVGDEPSKSKIKHHLIWDHLVDSTLIKKNLVELVPSKEIDLIESYFNDHDVRPYFKIEKK
ncbi:MAG: hypothetical protein LAT68_00545 [Cyclobacteriaceae bacterium]|nr:hypothetical protein [Cyclobacteriaceae bacterium]MCH8514791.1 hypothetical protein [Cyclobacteriaceae bacterium]